MSQNNFIHVGALARLLCNDPSSSGLQNSWKAHELVWFHQGSTLIQTLGNVPLLFMLKTKTAIYSKQKYVCIMLQATHIRAATGSKAAKAWSLAGF